MQFAMSLSFALAVALSTAAGGAFAFNGETLAKEAGIKTLETRAIALKAHPVTVADEELERGKGGSGLRYTFNIKRGTAVRKVGVDGKDGKVWESAPKAAQAI